MRPAAICHVLILLLAWTFALPALAQGPAAPAQEQTLVDRARLLCTEVHAPGRVQPAEALRVVNFFAAAELEMGRPMVSLNLAQTRAPYLLDGVRQRFEVPVVQPGLTAAPAQPWRIRAWVRSGKQGTPAQASDIELQVPEVASVIPASEWRTDAQAQRQLGAEIVIPSRPSAWHSPVEVSVMMLGCPLTGTASPWVARFNAEMSSRSVAILLTAAMVIGLYLLLIHTSPMRKQSLLILARMKAQGREISPWLEWRTRWDPVIMTQSAAGYGQLNVMQVWFFTMIIAGLLTYVMVRAGYLANLSQPVLELLGIASLGSALATVTTQARSQGEIQGPLPQTIDFLERVGILSMKDRFGTWSDLTSEGGGFGVHKFQVLVFSCIVGAWLVWTGSNDLASFTIPSGMLGLLGISQVIYVAGKGLAPPADWKPLNDAVKLLTDGEPEENATQEFKPLAHSDARETAARTLLATAPALLARYQPVLLRKIVAAPVPPSQ